VTERGIRIGPYCIHAYIRIAGKLRHKRYPLDTSLLVVRQWREQQRAKAILGLPEDTSDAKTLAEDCATYLEAVAGMPTIADRTYQIQAWRDALGPTRRRASVTSVEIRQQLESWRVDGKQPTKRNAHPGGLSPASLNLRRTALMHLWAVLDGRSAINPVKDVPRFREVTPPLRLPSIAEAERAIAAVGHPKKKSQSRARLSVLLWTGWPAAKLTRVTPRHVDLNQARAFVKGRRKGEGTRDRWLPLLPQAVKALKELKRVKAWGAFSNSSLHSALQRGCVKAKVTPFRTYDLRHVFLSEVALATKDDRVVAELAMHADIRMTRRYTESTVDPRLTAGLALVSAHLETLGTSQTGPDGAAGRARRRKRPDLPARKRPATA
jgi:integrase